MKKLLLLLFSVIIVCAACSLETQQGTVVINFCDENSQYIDCPEFELSQSVLKMVIQPSQGVTVDSVVFELPNTDSLGNPVYCSTDANSIALQNGMYIITVSCDLSEYADQNTQLNFEAGITVQNPDQSTSTVTVDGNAEDYVE